MSTEEVAMKKELRDLLVTRLFEACGSRYVMEIRGDVVRLSSPLVTYYKFADDLMPVLVTLGRNALPLDIEVALDSIEELSRHRIFSCVTDPIEMRFTVSTDN